jgi:hypothetical protein
MSRQTVYPSASAWFAINTVLRSPPFTFLHPHTSNSLHLPTFTVTVHRAGELLLSHPHTSTGVTHIITSISREFHSINMSDSLQSQNDSSQQAAPVMSEPPAKRQRKSGKNSYPAVVEKPNSPLVNANLKVS